MSGSEYTHVSVCPSVRRFLYDRWDEVILFAAGNDGESSSMYDLPFGVAGGATAKNAIVVGASEVSGSDQGLRYESHVTMCVRVCVCVCVCVLSMYVCP